MSSRLSRVFLASLTFALSGTAPECEAGFTFYGPTPYLSAADSPFAEHLGKPNFYLEDFEDGELNTPGIRQPLNPVFGTGFQGIVMGPSEFTDSVDADDGTIDGWGNSGHSFRSVAHFSSLTDPPSQQFLIEFEFDSSEVQELPKLFGFVWTDGRLDSSLSMTVTTQSGMVIKTPSQHRLGDETRMGTTSEDVFFGVSTTEGISSVSVSGGYSGESIGFDFFEIDHVQYGHVVPEPGVALNIMLLMPLLFPCWRS